MEEPEPLSIFVAKLPVRRLPGTLALASTNGLAGSIVFTTDTYAEVAALGYLQKFFPLTMWGALFVISANLLLIAAFTRKWIVFNLGAALSLFLWATVTISLFLGWYSGTVVLSPIALAMAWWMLVGQLTMLAVPLFKKWGEPV